MSGSLYFNYQGQANVVLRGAGANSTFLIWNGAPSSSCNGLGATAICLINGDTDGWYSPGNTASWTSGYSRGTSTINLSSVANLKVGSQLWLSQADSLTDNGNAWFCGSLLCSEGGGSGVAITNRTESQSVTVTGCGTTSFGSACTSNTVSISPALYAPNWSSSSSPQAGWSSRLPISNVGIENLSTDVSGIGLIFIYMLDNASNVWVSGVRSVNGTTQGQAARSHVIPWQANHVTVQNSYFYGSNPNSEGYGLAPSGGTNDSLFQNNICQHIATCEITQTGVGNVFGYNYAVDNYFGSGWQQCDQFHHGAGDYYNLWEGNIGTCNTQDSLHGTAFANTLYRNALSGYDAPGSPSANLLTINNMAYARYMNYAANVLGYGGRATNYQYAMTSTTDCGSGSNGWVFAFDDSDQNVSAYTSNCGFGSVINDLTAGARPSASSMRWGNWDGVNGGVRKVSSETGSSAPAYPALASPTSTFPSSLYAPGKPAWWGSLAWPGIGPDVSGGNIPGTAGHANLNPAANCYQNVMGGPTTSRSGPLKFDPSNCYSSSSASSNPPPAPTGLSGSVI